LFGTGSKNISREKGTDLYSKRIFFQRRLLATWALIAICCLVFGVKVASADTNDRLSRPGSHLGPSPDSPIFLGVFAQIGGGLDYDMGLPGYGTVLLFRPGAAADFLPFLYRWNSGLCLQIDFQEIAENQDILSGDLIFRKYLQEITDPESPGSFFLGAGIGASRVHLPAGSSGAGNKYWSWLLETGREWPLKQKYVFWVKGQYRHYDFSGFDYSNLTLQVGLGMPLPW
jgi:hypothetical protein